MPMLTDMPLSPIASYIMDQTRVGGADVTVSRPVTSDANGNGQERAKTIE